MSDMNGYTPRVRDEAESKTCQRFFSKQATITYITASLTFD